MKKIIIFSVLLLFSAAGAATYYVSPLGNDSYPGTSPDKALKTLRQALRKAGSGDTVLLKGGLYFEQISREWPQKNPRPITIKAMPDESPVITFGWRVRNWKKTPEGLFTAFSPHAVCDLWQRTPLERYLKVNSAELVRKQPGAFFQDPANGRLLVNPFVSARYAHPEEAGFTAVPYTSGTRPLPFNSKRKRLLKGGMNLVGTDLHIDGLHFAFHPREGFFIRGRLQDAFYGSGTIRNCTAIGTTAGFRIAWVLDGVTIENCRAIRNAGTGIQVGSYQKNIMVRNNFLLDNGGCQPFYDNFTATEGNLYNLSRYGSPEAEYVHFIGNKVISLDKSRHGRVMRCKSGIRKHTDVKNNVLAGGGTTFYAVPGSTADISNNTVFPGKLYFTVTNTGKKYHPTLKDNIHGLKSWQKEAKFVNPEKYDFRLLPSSPFAGKGAFPGAPCVRFASPAQGLKGEGWEPETPCSVRQLPALLKSGETVYFLPGTYSGTFTFRDLENITLSDKSCGKALWRNCRFKFENCRNVRLDSMDFVNCSFDFIKSTVSFTENIFSKARFRVSGGKCTFANSRLFNVDAAGFGRMVFRENLMDNCSVKCADVVSEHNGFATAEQLKGWPFSETFPSFTAGKMIRGKVTFPAENLVDGLAGSRIGGRTVPIPPRPLNVKNAHISPFECGTRALVSWNTPRRVCESRSLCQTEQQKSFRRPRPLRTLSDH